MTEATEAQIESTITAFAEAARRLDAVGVHGIELHGAHGYLLCQFLSSVMNQRADQWGGSLENRARMLRRAMQAVRAAVKDDFVLGVRLSPESAPSMPGLDLDETLHVAQWLCDDGADFIHISLWESANNTQKRPDEHPTRIFRDALPTEVPLVVAGKIWTTEEALAQLDHGADAIALGRAAIANPDWPQRVVTQGKEPQRFPMTKAALAERAVGAKFQGYLGEGMVVD